QSGNPLPAPPPPDLVLAPRYYALGDRRRGLPHARRDLRARDRRHPPEHRRRDRDVRRDLLRHPAAHERLADELEQRDQPVPAERGRTADLLPHPRLPLALTVA